MSSKNFIIIILCVCMYKMSDGAERFTKERKITVKTNTK